MVLRQFLPIILVGLLALSLAAPAGGQEATSSIDTILLESATFKAFMQEDGTTSITMDARVTNVGIASVQTVEVRVDSIEVTLTKAMFDGEDANATSLIMERHTMIVVHLQSELKANQSASIHLELRSTDLQDNRVNGDDESFTHGSFVFYMRPHTTISNLTFYVYLPAHSSLSHDSISPIFPDAEANFTDGESLAFKWFLPVLQPGQERVFIVRYQSPHSGLVQSEPPTLVALVTGATGAVLGATFVLAGPTIIGRFKRKGSVHYAGLTSEEEEILAILRRDEGSTPQKELYRQLPISDSKLSLLLGNLEERGLVRRARKGRENTVHLKE
jgi:hypothetical protein